MLDHLRPVITHVWQRRDPRLYQIAALAGLFGYGVVGLDFAVSGVQAAALLGIVLLTQAVCSRPAASGLMGAGRMTETSRGVLSVSQ